MLPVDVCRLRGIDMQVLEVSPASERMSQDEQATKSPGAFSFIFEI